MWVLKEVKKDEVSEMRKFLSVMLIIALFCGNITPVYAGDNVMLAENSVERNIVIEETSGSMDEEGVIGFINSTEENDVTEENNSRMEDNMIEEDILFEDSMEKDSVSEETVTETNCAETDSVIEESGNLTEKINEENELSGEEIESEITTEDKSVEQDGLGEQIEGECQKEECNDKIEDTGSASEEGTLGQTGNQKEENDIHNSESGEEALEFVSANSLETVSEEKVLALKIKGKTVGNYSKWSEVEDYISEVANATEEYVVEISEAVELDETLKIPNKIGKIVIRGTNNSKPVMFSVVGDVKVSSPLVLENIELKTNKYNSKTKVYEEYYAIVTLNGKELELKNSVAKVSAINGKASSLLRLEDSEVEVKKALSGVEKVCLEKAELKVKTANITDELEMTSSVLEAEGKISLKNLYSNDEYNKIIYGSNGSEGILNITGNVASNDYDGEEKVIWQTEIEGEYVEETVKIRKNAVDLSVKSLEENGYVNGSLLANISKAGSVWFVLGSKWEQKDGEKVRVVEGVTYKTNMKIYYGNTSNNVLLSSSDTEEEDDFLLEGGFATLQDALNEIDKKANASKFYRVLLNNCEENIATFSNKAIKFPTKAKGILIRKSSGIQEGNLYFKGNLTLNCNVKFEDIIFRNSGKPGVSLGKYVLQLKNCYSNDDAQAVVFNGITGNGVKKTSKLVLEDTLLRVNTSVNNVGEVCFCGTGTEELATSSAEEILRVVPAYPELMVNGKVNIGNVKLDNDGKITGLAKITRKAEVITKLISEITINGEITSLDSRNLYLDLQEKTTEGYGLINFDSEELNEWKQDKGIMLAKALGTTYTNVYFFRNSRQALTRQNGYFTYYESGQESGNDFYGVELSFEKDGKPMVVLCRSFNDAVVEINNQKVKRDYTIVLRKEIENILLKAPMKLTFPNNKYINSLVLQGEEQVGDINLPYTGNITFTSPVTLKNLSFVQMVKQKNVYKKVKEVKEDYPAIVTVKTGGYDLWVEGEVIFDVPVKIDGGSKGSLFLNGKLITDTNDCEVKSTKNNYVLYGMLTNINTLSLSEKNLSLREIRNKRYGNKYTSSSNKITNLYLEDAEVEVIGYSGNNSLNVQNLLLQNSEIKVEGNGTFKNVTMEGTREAVISVDKTFNITGVTEVNTDNARLETRRKGSGKEPYLNVSGTVVRKEGTNPVYVGVYYENGAGELMKEKAVKLLDAPKATGQLLTAKKALATDFRPIEENFPAGEYSEDNTNGYVMVKKSGKIYTYSGEKYK